MASEGRLRDAVASLGERSLGVISFVGGAALLLRDASYHVVVGPFRRRPVSAKAFFQQAVRVTDQLG